MAGYRRPLSRSELRQIRRQKGRIIIWCGVAVFLALISVVGLVCLMYEMPPL